MIGPLARPLAQPLANSLLAGAASGSLRLLGTRGALGGSVISGGRQHMASLKVLCCYDATNLKIMLAGPRGSSGLPSSITVTAAIWKDGTAYQVTFSGNTSISLADDAYTFSDDIVGLSVSAGDHVYIRTYATVTSGSSMWETQYLNGNNGDGVELGGTDKTMSGTVTDAGAGASAQRVYTAAGLLGICFGHGVVVFGDSRTIGTGDSKQIGYVGIACERNLLPFIRVGQGGSTTSAGVSLIQSDAAIRAVIPYVTAATWQYGVNDLSSSALTATLRSRASTFASEIASLKPGIKLSIHTILPVVNGSNTNIKNDSYWNSTKEAERVTYNNSLRGGVPTGFHYLWEAAGDASGVSGLFQGAEATKDAGTYRSDYATLNGFSAVNDGLHPDRPLLTAAAAALNVNAWLGITQKWGPEIMYCTIPSSGLYMTANLLPSHSEVTEVPGSLAGISVVQAGGSSEAVVLMEKVSASQVRLYLYDRFDTGATEVLTVATSNSLVNAAGATGQAVTIPNTNIANSSTWAGSSDPGTVLATDDFARADTSYNASANNNTAGSDWTDAAGNAAKIASNKLKIQGNDGRIVYWNAATYTDIAAEIEFDPADSTASSSVPFDFRIGCRINPGTGAGIYARVNRAAELGALSRLELQYISNGSTYTELGASNYAFNNGTTYRLRLSVSGSGSSKSVVARLLNASTGDTILTLTGSSSLNSYTDAAGYCGVVTARSATNDASAAVATEMVLDNFKIRSVSDSTAPVLASLSLSSSKQYVAASITELGLPLKPSSSAAGFTAKDNGIAASVSESVIYGCDQVRIVLSSAAIGTVTISYDQSTGNVLDQSNNELIAFTDQTAL